MSPIAIYLTISEYSWILKTPLLKKGFSCSGNMSFKEKIKYLMKEYSLSDKSIEAIIKAEEDLG